MVNPAHLKSLVDQHATGPSPSDLGVPVADPGPDPDDGMDDEEEEAPAADPASHGEEIISGWGEFGDTFKGEAKELHDQAMDVGADLLLKDVPDDAIKDVEKAVDRMPDDMAQGLAKYVSKLSPEDCDAVAAALSKEIGADADEKLLAAFLGQAGKYAGDEVDVDDDFNEPDEDEDEDEDGDFDDEEPSGADMGATPPVAPDGGGDVDY